MSKSFKHKKTKLGRDIIAKHKKKQRSRNKACSQFYSTDVIIDQDNYLDQLDILDDTFYKHIHNTEA